MFHSRGLTLDLRETLYNIEIAGLPSRAPKNSTVYRESHIGGLCGKVRVEQLDKAFKDVGFKQHFYHSYSSDRLKGDPNIFTVITRSKQLSVIISMDSRSFITPFTDFPFLDLN